MLALLSTKPIKPKLPLHSHYINLFHAPTQSSPQTHQTQQHPSLRTMKNPSLQSITPLHCLSLKSGSLTDVHTLTTFLVLYVKSHHMDSSWKLFDEMPTRDVISWNAMTNACVCNKNFELAVDLFWEMRWKETCGIDSTTLVIVVSALSRMKGLKQGRILHGLGLKSGLGFDCFLCNAFIDMYGKCGDLCSAELVFEDMEYRDASSWNSVMSGCVRNGYAEKSLSYFKDMIGLSCIDNRADHLSISCTISACSSLGDLHCGQTIHGLAIKLGYEETDYISMGNTLISLYSQCGDIEDAESVFRGLVYKDDVVSWNSMIHGFAKEGMTVEAFTLLHEMQTRAIDPDYVTLVSVLPICAEFSLLEEGRNIHGFIIRRQMTWDNSLRNSLMDMYLKCKFIKPAELLFANKLERDIVSWNSMISGYAHNGLSKEAQALFKELLCSGPACRVLTLLAVLSSCDIPDELMFGKLIHSLHLKLGFTDNFMTINATMFMYINCGDVLASLRLLSSIQTIADVVSWNTVIVGCAQNGYLHEALEAFNQMRCSSHVNPDSITLVSVLSACGDLQLISQGKSLHGFSLKTPIGSDIRVRNSLITMYSRCEDVEDANFVFIRSPYRNLCSWNCMISGFSQNKDGQRALELFQRLNDTPNEFTAVSILSASTQIGSLRHGKQIHGYLLRFGYERNLFISTALLDMYSKCGRLDVAIQIFRDSPEKSVASWNCMISAYGLHGHGGEVIKLFAQMSNSGTRPTKSTFISLLSACSHSGLLEEGCLYYKIMSTEFGLKPTTEHHVCFVDMLGRGGRLVEAYKFIEGIKTQAVIGVWGALLGACKYHGDVKMGKEVAEHLFEIDPENCGYYVSLFNIYAVDAATGIRRTLDDNMLRNHLGVSSAIE